VLKSPTVLTKLDVISDAIKIGLPLLGAGLIAVFTFRATRSHEREKERQRRHQDALEKIMDDFQTACSALSDLAVGYSVYRESGGMGSEDLWKSGRAIEAAAKELHRIGGRLKLLQLKKCEQALIEFHGEMIDFRKMLKLPPEPMAPNETVRQKFGELKVLQGVVERSLADAFNSL